MNKKVNGFTLVELLAVIVVLGIISAVASGLIINSLRNAKSDIDTVQKKLIEDTAKLYYQDNYGEEDYDFTNNKICVQTDLVDGDYLDAFIDDNNQNRNGVVNINKNGNKMTFTLTVDTTETGCVTKLGDGK